MKALTKLLNPLTLYEFVAVVAAAVVVVFGVVAAAVWPIPNSNPCVPCVNYSLVLSPQMIF